MWPSTGAKKSTSNRPPRLAPAAVLTLARRPRTPSSITYKPPPLRFQLEPVSLDLPVLGGAPIASVEATVFDFAAVSVALHAPFVPQPPNSPRGRQRFADPATAPSIVQAAPDLGPVARTHSAGDPKTPLARCSLGGIHRFPVSPRHASGAGHPVDGTGRLVGEPPPAGRSTPQRGGNYRSAALSLRYGLGDLFVPDWAAAVLLDDEQGVETLQTIEFANLQLLEFRHIDDRLDTVMARRISSSGRWRIRACRFCAAMTAPLRILGELKVEANGLFERTGNVFKLIGDQYLARLYRLLARRFHLSEWEGSIQRKLEVIEGVYRVVSNQTVTFRMEFMEGIVILLIFLEILLAFFRH